MRAEPHAIRFDAGADSPAPHAPHQQCAVVRSESAVVKASRGKELPGYTAGDWREEEWRDCLEKHDVLVGTATIFKQTLIDKGFLRHEDLSLCVFDECRRAHGRNDMAMILQHLHAHGRSKMTRVLGLTASFSYRASGSRARLAPETDRRLRATHG